MDIAFTDVLRKISIPYKKIKNLTIVNKMKPPKGFLNLFSSVQQALVGKVTPNLRALRLVFKNDTTYILVFYYDQPLSEKEERLPGLVYGYVSSDFSPPIFTSSYVIKILPYPNKMDSEGHCLYRRYEES